MTRTDNLGRAMTLDEMDAVAGKARAIRIAQQRLVEATNQLSLLHAYPKRKQDNWQVEASWNPTLLLSEPNRDGYGGISIKIRLPYGVVEQQLVDEVSRCRREVIKLGGTVPPIEPKKRVKP